MLINFGKEYCLCGNVGFPFVNPTYEAAIALPNGVIARSFPYNIPNSVLYRLAYSFLLRTELKRGLRSLFDER
jgi:hypothetical protein